MTYKELSQYRGLIKRIEQLEAQKEEIAQLSASMINGLPRGKRISDPTYQAYLRADKLDELVMEERIRAVAELERLTEYIASVEDVEMQNILTARFVEGKTYEEIGEKLYMHQSTVYKKLQHFLKIQRNQNQEGL